MNCYHCQSNINDYDIFCHNCGKELINNCSNNECHYSYKSVTSTDKYCRLCGSNTTFKEKGYIKDGSKVLESDTTINSKNINHIDYDSLPLG